MWIDHSIKENNTEEYWINEDSLKLIIRKSISNQWMMLCTSITSDWYMLLAKNKIDAQIEALRAVEKILIRDIQYINQLLKGK
jgi:hypothetical protein